MSRLKEYATFFGQFRRRFETTGAIAPSSRFLAAALVGPLAARPAGAGPVRIAEIGPGTGAVTRRIVRLLRPGDWLDVVELNETFAAHLRDAFAASPQADRLAAQAAIHEIGVQAFEAERPYDFIISGLPLNNFPAALVDDVFDAYLRLLAPGGTLSYFEYMFVRRVRMRLGAADERARLARIEATVGRHVASMGIGRDWVFLNVPPAWAQHIRKPSS